MAVDQDTKKYLEEARKGKPRKFVMICKGNKILSLVVYKKGSTQKYKKQAKEEGAGQFYYGMISGKGPNITFNMNSMDGFDKPATKNIVLKNYLMAEAGMKFKPVYEIVTELPEMPDEEGPSEEDVAPARPSATEPSAEAPGEESPVVEAPSGEAPVDDVAIQQLKTALKKLLQRVSKVVRAKPALKEEILRQVAIIKTAIKDGDTETARAQLLETGMLVKRVVITPRPDRDDGDVVVRPPEDDGEDEPVVPWNFDAAKWASAKQTWEDALSTVDGQISRLQSALRRQGDDELEEIAEFGLNGVTGNHKVPLRAAIMNIDSASGAARGKEAVKARKAVASFLDHIKSDERVMVCDEGGKKLFGVDVNIQQTLTPALKQMQEALESQH